MTEEQAEQQVTMTVQRVAYLLALWQAGQMSTPDFTAGAAVATYAGKVVASTLADAFVSTIASVPPTGVRPSEDHLDRLAAAVNNIVEADPEPTKRVLRLAEAEVLLSHRASLQAALRDAGYEYWTRVVADDPCPDCAPLAGEVQPITATFRDHVGCRCSLRGSGPRTAAPEPPTAPVAPSSTRTAPSPPNRVLRIG